MRDGSLHPMGTGRAPGIHASDIIREMKKAAGEKVTPIEGEDPNVRPQAGFWWETALAYAVSQHLVADEIVSEDVIWQPQLSLEGLPISPDGIDQGRLISIKMTWRSMKPWEEDAENNFGFWMVHDMASMKALREEGYGGLKPKINTVRYFLFWVMGDYSRKAGRGPQRNYCDVTFTDEAIDKNWLTMKRYWQWMVERGENLAKEG